MNQINYIKVGGTTYSIPGSGGGLYDAVIRRMTVYDSNGIMSSNSIDLMDGDFYTCLSKLENNEYLTIGIYEVEDARSINEGITTDLFHCKTIMVDDGQIIITYDAADNLGTNTITWTDSNISISYTGPAT